MAKVIRFLLLTLLLAGIAVLVAYRDQLNGDLLTQWVSQLGSAGPLVFMIIYALGTVLFLPSSLLTLVGGAVFGPLWGTFYNLTGATIGATFSFLIARYLAADWVEHKSAGRLKQIKRGVEGEGWRFVAFVRLVPLFPFNALNYALGLTRIKLSHYIIASYLCMLPGAFAYTWLGYAGREAVAGGEGVIQKGLLALALLAAVSFLPRLITRLRRGPMLETVELRTLLASESPPLILDVRSEAEFTGEEGHIDGALNIPVEVLPQRLNELDAYREQPVVIICHTDRRSTKAALLLAKGGFANVQVVRGGMVKWNAEIAAFEKSNTH